MKRFTDFVGLVLAARAAVFPDIAHWDRAISRPFIATQRPHFN
jgi:hypothetical protein